MRTTGADLLEQMMLYEEGALSDEGTLELFAVLIREGMAWTLQGSYGRAARWFIDEGFISPEGEIDWDRYNEVLEEVGW